MSKFNITPALTWIALSMMPFIFFVAINTIALKASDTATAYALVPYAAVLLFTGLAIKGFHNPLASLRGLISLPFLMTGLCGLFAIGYSALMMQ